MILMFRRKRGLLIRSDCGVRYWGRGFRVVVWMLGVGCWWFGGISSCCFANVYNDMLDSLSDLGHSLMQKVENDAI